MASTEIGNAEERCRLCGSRERCSLDRGRLLGCLNLCLVVTGFVYVAALHRHVSGIRTELGRCHGASVQTRPTRDGGQIDNNIVKMENKVTYTAYGDGEVTEVSETNVL